MQSGRLRHRIEIQRAVITRDDVGQEIITWVTVATIWARVEISQSAREGFIARADQLHATADYKITARYTTSLDITVKDRVHWGTIAIDVQNVIADPVRRQWIILGESAI